MRRDRLGEKLQVKEEAHILLIFCYEQNHSFVQDHKREIRKKVTKLAEK